MQSTPSSRPFAIAPAPIRQIAAIDASGVATAAQTAVGVAPGKSLVATTNLRDVFETFVSDGAAWPTNVFERSRSPLGWAAALRQSVRAVFSRTTILDAHNLGVVTALVESVSRRVAEHGAPNAADVEMAYRCKNFIGMMDQLHLSDRRLVKILAPLAALAERAPEVEQKRAVLWRQLTSDFASAPYDDGKRVYDFVGKRVYDSILSMPAEDRRSLAPALHKGIFTTPHIEVGLPYKTAQALYDELKPSREDEPLSITECAGESTLTDFELTIAAGKLRNALDTSRSWVSPGDPSERYRCVAIATLNPAVLSAIAYARAPERTDVEIALIGIVARQEATELHDRKIHGFALLDELRQLARRGEAQPESAKEKARALKSNVRVVAGP